MRQLKSIIAVIVVLAAFTAPAFAGVPLNNLQGVGGIAFNPLAYPAGQNDKTGGPSQRLSNPQFGVWYVRLGGVKVDWVAAGIA